MIQDGGIARGWTILAAERLTGSAVRTPLLESPWLNERTGARLLIKAEPLQRTGSFKFRGAFNCISQIDPRARALGVVAYSSGNHAQAVAAAARRCRSRSRRTPSRRTG